MMRLYLRRDLSGCNRETAWRPTRLCKRASRSCDTGLVCRALPAHTTLYTVQTWHRKLSARLRSCLGHSVRAAGALPGASLEPWRQLVHTSQGCLPLARLRGLCECLAASASDQGQNRHYSAPQVRRRNKVCCVVALPCVFLFAWGTEQVVSQV